MFLTRLAWFSAVQLLASFAVASFAVAAEPKAPGGRIAVGDLAEYVSGLGPMLGEVLSGPDASSYYLLLVPSAGEVPIHATKLRLVQRGGAPKAPFNPRDIVDVRTDSNMVQRASVVKVNRGWCQVQAPSVVGWAECKGLRVVQRAGNGQAAAQTRPEEGAQPPSAPPAPVSGKPGKATGSTLRGTYQNANGEAVIEFLSEGKAFFSFHGVTGACTHKQNGKDVILTCDDEDMVFTVNDDGSLAGPPDSFVSRMKKKS